MEELNLKIEPQKRLYGYSGFYHSIFFTTKEELDTYLITHQEEIARDFGTSCIIDYLGDFEGHQDVILETPLNGAKKVIMTAIDCDRYAIYNSNQSMREGKPIWDYEYGSATLKDMYKAFCEQGVKFSKDIYQDIDNYNKILVKQSVGTC